MTIAAFYITADEQIHPFSEFIYQSWSSLPLVLTHLCLASHKRDISKQCRPRSRSTLFALNTGFLWNIVMIKTNQTPLLETDLSKELR